jgi:hypothetical protein
MLSLERHKLKLKIYLNEKPSFVFPLASLLFLPGWAHFNNPEFLIFQKTKKTENEEKTKQ